MSKKNLDKLFQEKLSDFGEVPDEKVWNAIEASLNKKKRKRVIPIWWKLGGIAAVLALALVVWNPFANNDGTPPAISDTNKSDNRKRDINQEGQEDTLQLPEINNGTITVTTTDEQVLDSETGQGVSSDAVNGNTIDDSSSKSTQKEQMTDKKSSVVGRNTKSLDASQKSNPLRTQSKPNSETIRLTATGIGKDENDDSKTPVNSITNKERLAIGSTEKNDAIAHAFDKQADETNISQTTDGKKRVDPIAEMEKDAKSDHEVLNSKEKNGFATKEKLAQNNQNNTETNEPGSKKKSIFEAIDEQQNEEEVADETSNRRWSAGPNVAPVYFNALGEGSPVHSAFSENSKSGNMNLSYGLAVAYAVNKKLRIRSGLHKVAYGYDTDGVEFSSSLQATATDRIENIDYTATAKNLVVQSEAGSLSVSEASPNDFAELNATASSARNGTMAQQFGYLEVPLELDYALIDRKFGVNLVGGISSLFLLDNSVTLTSGDLTTEIGEANNINNVNFSTNIGFGVNYKFTPTIQLNVEPVFKYQLNTFSDVSGDFRPFSVGVYSGLNFKF